MMTAMIIYVLHCARDAHPLLCFCFVLFLSQEDGQWFVRKLL